MTPNTSARREHGQAVFGLGLLVVLCFRGKMCIVTAKVPDKLAGCAACTVRYRREVIHTAAIDAEFKF